jgi:hypothetical protein
MSSTLLPRTRRAALISLLINLTGAASALAATPSLTIHREPVVHRRNHHRLSPPRHRRGV